MSVVASFYFPSIVVIFAAPILAMIVGWVLVRKIAAAIFFAFAGLFIAWTGYESLLHQHMEKWLSQKREYSILFRDFPQDKEHFISDFINGFHSGGNEGVARKEEEEKVIMSVNHIKHYIARNPASVIQKYVNAQTWLLSALYAKNQELCSRYLGYSGYFAEVWNIVGNEIFLNSVKYFPEMIIEAEEHPEVPTEKEISKEISAFSGMMSSLKASGLNSVSGREASCYEAYQIYYSLSQLPPKDQALIVKMILSEQRR